MVTGAGIRGLRLLALAIGVVLGTSAVAGAGATEYPAQTVRVEIRVWQNADNDREIHVGARSTDGSWTTLGLTPLLLDDGFSRSGRFRYGNSRLDVPLPERASPATVEVRVWQNVDDGWDLYISARPAGGSWGTLGTIPLPWATASSAAPLRYGDVAIDVPLSDVGVSTFATGFGSPDRGASGQFGLGLTADRDGNIIVADERNHVIRRIAPDGTVTTIAGGPPGLRDGPAEAARFQSPNDVAVGPDDAIYVADTGNHRIRKIALDGRVTTVAGSDRAGVEWWEIRGGPASQAMLASPTALAFDPYGDLYIVQRFGLSRLSPSGWVSTVAERTTFRWGDGPVEQVEFHGLHDIAVDDAGNLYLIDDSRGGVGSQGPVVWIRRIDTNGVVTTLYRDDPPSLGGTLAYPSGLAVTGDGAVYLANTGRHQIVRLTADGRLQAVAGTGSDGLIDGAPGQASFATPGRIAFLPDGSLAVADQRGTLVRRIVLQGGPAEAIPLATATELPRVPGAVVSVFAGAGEQGFVDGQGAGAQFLFPVGMTLDGAGNVIVADSGNDAIRLIDADATVTTLAGGNGAGGRDGLCEDAQFDEPAWVAWDPRESTIYVSDWGGHRIRRVDATDPGGCSVTTIAGGERGFNDGPAADARFSWPAGVAIDHGGNLWIADLGNNLIRRLSPEGRVATIAGLAGRADGAIYNPGTRDGRGAQALFALPKGITIGAEGDIFFTEGNAAIRKIDRSGYVSTVLKTPDYDEGGALSPFTSGIAVGRAGELYIADFGLDRVLRLAPDGALSIVLDRETEWAPGDRPSDPYGLGLDPHGLLVMPDSTLLVTLRHTGVVVRITFGE